MLFSRPGYSASLLSDIQNDDQHNDTVIYSDNRSVTVHAAIISRCSVFLSNILVTKGSQTILLPGFSYVVHNFVTLVYKGRVTCRCEEDYNLLSLLCTQLGMEIFAKGDDNHDIIDLKSNVLKVKTEIFCGESH